MKILLPTLHVRRSAQAVPLAAGCLAATLPPRLRDAAELLDFFPEDTLEQMVEEILGRHPDLVAFPVYVWNRQQILALTRALRQAQPALRLVAGGPEATADAAGVLAGGALDGVVHDEGETVFALLADGWQTAATRPGCPASPGKRRAGPLPAPRRRRWNRTGFPPPG